MLGWMLGRGDNAPDAVDTGDTTLLDLPDTPGPVFAARSFKSALFGTPIRDAQRASRDRAKAAKSTTMAADHGLDTPLKPQGILLTPGTGTSRPKRVSFNRDLATTKTISPNGEGAAVSKRTRLSDVLDKARRKSTTNVSKVTEPRIIKDEPEEDEWEEDELDDNGEYYAHDTTVDLNEPHSQSGKYWKEEFEKYHREARAEMEKLLKYKKHLKSYAEEKDLEAIHLAQRLKEEQEKVIAMEKRIAENANQMASKQNSASSSETAELLATLTKQTALAAQYRHRVQELEAQLEELHQAREEDDESREWRRLQGTTSPNTARTLVETQRELRRSRAQLKELDALRDQVSSLKAQLKVAEQRKVADHPVTDEVTDTTKMKELKAQLKQAREESSRKDSELGQLKKEFDMFKKEREAHDADTKGVLERAQTKITDLKKEIKTLKAKDAVDGGRSKGRNYKPGDNKPARDDEDEIYLPRFSATADDTRRSIDVADLERPRHLFEAGNAKFRTLRDKYQTDATPGQSRTAAKSRGTTEASGDRLINDKSKWQPSASKASRDRASASEAVPKRSQPGNDAGSDNIALAGMPAFAKSMAQSKKPASIDDTDVEIDLLQDRFTRLGSGDSGQERLKEVPKSGNGKASLPPERRAAALARIEKRMAEKRAQRRDGTDKENVRP
ncbi:uncharacterized protein TRIVIDRAFT_229224 [Trichoderma virens Gv29-8]|uniref:Spindle pole body-associated protein cut12 domain-containing protein n=1 Tax=Hypocrea virens (strain Gv29-8 / FGSC 10586) TaxID=413071 RepID=G9MHA3_HYPVG|nr:uncharacterized protein TRIVIDRAFT_229224 [Trichoderma virens Gv29-8]EHK26091.1 hypothetical protein TRIVIDRAFT_229224 [Trichoderma virens Gv29-8]